MKEQVTHLNFKIAQLKASALNETCDNCSLKENYITKEYHQLRKKAEAVEKLAYSNFRQQNIFGIDELKQSVSILGMYILV